MEHEGEEAIVWRTLRPGRPEHQRAKGQMMASNKISVSKSGKKVPLQPIYVDSKDKVSIDPATFGPGAVVTWRPNTFPHGEPADVFIRFLKGVPFSDWGTDTGRCGPIVSGTVGIVVGTAFYPYVAKYVKKSDNLPRANPQLIVEGGGRPDSGLESPDTSAKAQATKRQKSVKKK
jgi:hypothetical protein